MDFFKYNNSFPSASGRPNIDVPSQIFEWQNRVSVLQDIYEKNNDELWIESWLQQNNVYQPIPKIKVERVANRVQIGEAQVLLRNCLVSLEKLSEIQGDLEENVGTMSSVVWKKKTVEIGSLKDDFTKMVGRMDGPETLRELKISIDRRRKKRLKAKRRKERRREEVNRSHENRKKTHKDIDRWLGSMREEAEKQKMEETMKKDADCVLSEVTKKKSDARKQISLITSLIKLRTAREQMAAQRGEYVPLDDRNAFNITTEKLLKMWENTSKTYTTEEQGLRLMLEKNATEDSRAARIAKERKLVEEWGAVLFGPKHLTPVGDATYWALTAAERDAETFVAIRKSWDTFLVPPANDMGSKIPVGWVLPDAGAEDAWNKYLTEG